MALPFLLLLLLLLQDRSAVFAGTFGALAIMTLISVALGQVGMLQHVTGYSRAGSATQESRSCLRQHVASGAPQLAF
jgi:putative Ca2+/H+ antiporter (TMEM165/GDT1 family)